MSVEYSNYYNKDENSEMEDVSYMDVDEAELYNDSEIEGTVDEIETTTLMGKVVNAEKVYVRESPSRSAKDISVLNKDTEVLITGVEDDENGNGWYAITTASSIDGYILSDFVAIEE